MKLGLFLSQTESDYWYCCKFSLDLYDELYLFCILVLVKVCQIVLPGNVTFVDL